jgi:L-seryl-tRNA(Ser) seleniumtransferase
MSDLARIPKMDRILDAPALRELTWRREVVRRVAEEMLSRLRDAARKGGEIPDADEVARRVRTRLEEWARARPRRVINATGVVLHTNLGRAPLSDAAIEAMAGAAGSCDLEIDLVAGQRSSRYQHVRPLLRAVIGCEDVHVVNNNAAALLLACTVLGAPGGVVLSCGQMVEIGDGFRVATMAAAGGGRVIAVGSTNRTHRADYVSAVAAGASAILWVHLSNFSQAGFVAEVGLRELAEIAKAGSVPLVADLGSGSLGAGLPDREPTIASYLEDGADLVLASGDKLLGGPQAGIIAGRAELVARLRSHPMARALRPDKTTIAALHATAIEHARAGTPALPLHAIVGRTLDDLRARAQAISRAIGDGARVVDSDATIGGGSLPGDVLASCAVRVAVARPDALARALRMGEPAVVGRIEEDALLLDVRTVDPRDDDALALAVRSAVAAGA